LVGSQSWVAKVVVAPPSKVVFSHSLVALQVADDEGFSNFEIRQQTCPDAQSLLLSHWMVSVEHEAADAWQTKLGPASPLE